MKRKVLTRIKSKEIKCFVSRRKKCCGIAITERLCQKVEILYLICSEINSLMFNAVRYCDTWLKDVYTGNR